MISTIAALGRAGFSRVGVVGGDPSGEDAAIAGIAVATKIFPARRGSSAGGFGGMSAGKSCRRSEGCESKKSSGGQHLELDTFAHFEANLFSFSFKNTTSRIFPCHEAKGCMLSLNESIMLLCHYTFVLISFTHTLGGLALSILLLVFLRYTGLFCSFR